MKKVITATLVLVMSVLNLIAVNAYPHLVSFTQPDNNIVSIYIKGDEKVHWMESEDGYSLLYNNDGYLVYAMLNEKGDMVPSDIVAQNQASRTAEAKAFLAATPKYLRYTKSQINDMTQIWQMVENQKQKSENVTTGEVRLLLILMQFTDRTMVRSKNDFVNLFNQVNYSTNGANGSVHDFYYANSYGKLSLTFDVAGPYTTSRETSYYGNRTGGYQAFAKEAINAAAADVDYSNYDNNGDYELDGVHIIFAGFGEESTGNADLIWSHKSVLSPALRHDGISITKYSCSPELRGSSGSNITRIGVVCHELGHVFGAPDFYDTDYEESGGSFPGTGEWDLMGSGNWNDNGVNPAHHNPYTKIYIYGWAEAVDLDSSSRSVVMPSSSSSPNSFYRYNTTTQNEFFLLENRQQENFDAGTPGHGMIIYRIHSTMHPGASNINVTHPQKVYPISAASSYRIPASSSSTYGGINSSACPFPGTRKKTSFTDNTTPAAISWAGENTEKPITDIVENTTLKTISFVFNNGTKDPDHLAAHAITSTDVKVSWLPFGSLPVMVVYSTDSVFGTPDNMEYSVGQTINGGGTVIYTGTEKECTHQNLTPEQTYYYKVYTKLNSNNSEWSSGVATSITTPCRQLEIFPYRESFEGDTLPQCWQIETTDTSILWKIDTTISPKDGAQYVFTKNNDYSSGGKNVMLISAPMDMSAISQANISFWYVLRKRAVNQDSLTIMYRTSASAEWNVLATHANEATSWTKDTIQIPVLSNYCQIAFKATLNYGNGIAIDNMIVYVNSEGIETANGNNAPQIELYPNPAKEKVYVSIQQNDGEKTECHIYDMAGRQISTYQIFGNETHSINTDALRSGTYIMKFVSPTFEKTETLIIK